MPTTEDRHARQVDFSVTRVRRQSVNLYAITIVRQHREDMKNVVFFSRYKKDTYSPKLLAFMKRMPFRREFAYYCIDPHPVTRKRNDELLELLEVTEVPTLYVDGTKFVGQEAFEWLREQAALLQGSTSARQQQSDPYDDYQYQYQHQPQPGGEDQMPMSAPGPAAGVMGLSSTATGGRIPNHLSHPPSLQNDEALSPVGGGDSPYANPFAADPLNGPKMSPQQFLTPLETKNQDSSSRMDDELKRLAMERKSLMPQDGPGQGGLPGFGGRSMQDLQMPVRR